MYLPSDCSWQIYIYHLIATTNMCLPSDVHDKYVSTIWLFMKNMYLPSDCSWQICINHLIVHDKYISTIWLHRQICVYHLIEHRLGKNFKRSSNAWEQKLKKFWRKTISIVQANTNLSKGMKIAHKKVNFFNRVFKVKMDLNELRIKIKIKEIWNLFI